MAIIAAGLLLMAGCMQKMGTEGHLGVIARIPPEGTVAQEAISTLQPTLTRDLLETGREQYSVSCLPCHGPSGNGDGMVVQRGFLAPPSYHIDRLRNAPDSHFFDVITNGYGAMYSYADRVPVPDRWAIIAYIRALQLSQNAKWAELPVQDRESLK